MKLTSECKACEGEVKERIYMCLRYLEDAECVYIVV